MSIPPILIGVAVAFLPLPGPLPLCPAPAPPTSAGELLLAAVAAATAVASSAAESATKAALRNIGPPFVGDSPFRSISQIGSLRKTVFRLSGYSLYGANASVGAIT